MVVYIKKLRLNTLVLFLILSLIMLFVVFPLTACGGDKEGEGEETSATTNANGDEEPKPHKVGFIYSGTIENSTHNLIFENSRNQLERNLGVETCYIENVFVQNFGEAVDMLIERDVTVIISTSNFFSNAVKSAAQDYKDINFISFGGNSTLANLAIFNPLLYQPANVCGLAAAFNTEKTSLGIVADTRMFNCEGVINSYILGAKDFSINLDSHVNFVSSFNEDEIKEAIDNLVQKGNDVIMMYVLSDYGIKYCEEIGVKIIAYSGNLPDLAPNNYISGFYFNVDSYITEQVRFIQNDYFFPITTYGTMESGHVNMIALNASEKAVLPETKSLTDLLYKGIIDHDRIFMGEIVDRVGNVQVENGVILDYKEILNIAWLEFSVGENRARFSDPVEEILLVPLVVKGEWADDDPRKESNKTKAPDIADEPADEEAPPATETSTTTQVPSVGDFPSATQSADDAELYEEAA